MMGNSTEDDGRLSTGDDHDVDQPEGSSPDSSQINKIKSAIFENKPEDVEDLLKEKKALVKVEFDFTFNEDDPDESWTSEGMTPLAFAARLGHIEICRILLNYGADVAAKTKSNGTNTFWLAVLNDYMDIADLLCEEAEKTKVDVLELRSLQGDTALIRFAYLGESDLVEYLLAKGADIEAKEYGSEDTALHSAAMEGHYEVAEMLLNWKQPPNILELKNKSGQTPLLTAAELDKSRIALLLLNKGADYNIKDNDGNTALHYAAISGDEELAKKLLELEKQGLGESNEPNKTSSVELSRLLDMTNENKDTPLALAASNGHEGVFDFLVESGANADIQSKNGDTLLHRAAKNGQLNIVKKLLLASSEGSDSMRAGRSNEPNKTSSVGLSRLLDMTNENKDTPLALAVSNGHEAIFDFLLESGANPDIRSHNGDTLLHRAAKTGQLNIVEKLLPSSIEDSGSGQVKAEPVRNILGETPMMLAAQEDEFEVVEYLLSKNETFTEKGMKLEKAMLSAAHDGHIRLIQGLWSNPRLREIRDSSERTPLLIASEYGHAEIVEHLCQNGANLEAKDNVGDTPIKNAVYKSSAAMVRCLLNHGANQTATDGRGNNALHCVSYLDDSSEVVPILLADSLERLGKALSAENDGGNTPLCNACAYDTLLSGDGSIVFQLLGSKVYFPINPTEDRPHQSPGVEKNAVRDWLNKWILKRRVSRDDQKERGARERKKKKSGEEETQVEEIRQETGDTKSKSSKKPKQKNHTLNASLVIKEDESNAKHNQAELRDNRTREEDSKRIKSVIYWAILNNDNELVNFAMKEGGDPTLESEKGQKGATWLHIASLGNSQDVLISIKGWETLIQTKTERDITPLHVAARMGHQLLLRKLLSRLANLDEDKPLETLQDAMVSKVLSAIIHETEDGENLISLVAAKQEKDRLESNHSSQQCQRSEYKKKTNVTKHIGVSSHHSENDREDLAKDLLSELWRTVISAIKAKSRTSTNCSSFPYSLDAEYIVKSAASVYTIMNEDQLIEITSLMFGVSKQEAESLKASSSKFLIWTAKYEFPLAFCWLLSSGEYFGETHIENCQKAMKSDLAREQSPDSGEKRPQRREIIETLLRNQPPVRRFKEDTQFPSFLYSIPPSENRIGTVVDISQAQGQIYHNFNLKRADIFELIYDGPQKLMASNETYDCQAVIKNLFPTQSGTESSQTQDDSRKKKAPKQSAKETDRTGIRSTQEKVRWLHVPVNDLRYIQELMVQVSREKKRDNRLFRGLIRYFQGGMVELPAGGGKHYMMPHFQDGRNLTSEKNDRPTGGSSSDTLDTEKDFKGIALYMPYLYWGVEPDPRQGASPCPPVLDQENEQGKQSFGRKKHLHTSLTLDQYYYAALENTSIRDTSQVVGRYFARRHPPEQDPETAGQRQQTKETNSHKAKLPILVVNQLWLWIIDDDTIITSTTAESDHQEAITEEPDHQDAITGESDPQEPKSFVQRVLEELRKENGDSAPQVMRVAEVIRDTAANLFDAKEIKYQESEKVSTLDVFRTSIQDMRGDQIQLLKNFRESIGDILPGGHEKPSQTHANAHPPKDSGNANVSSLPQAPSTNHIPPPEPKSRWARFKTGLRKLRDRARSLEENPYENIVQETALLVEVNDIQDELNILSTLVHDQQHVCSLWKGPRKKSHVEGGYSSIDEREAVIEEMIQDAKSLEEAINKLLDLKQKQATIMEAQATRRQSDSVMVFTVVTVVFLPASFLASLFALDITEFPHVDGAVVFQGKWILPIMFGVAFAFALVFLPLAFKANFFKNLYKALTFKREPSGDEEAGDLATVSSYKAPSTGERSRRSLVRSTAQQ